MCSNFCKRGLISVLAAGLMLSACAREKELSAPPIKAATGSGQCFTSASETMTRYLESRLSPAEITSFWQCSSQALSDFRKLVAGDLPDGNWRPETLASFLQRHFLDGRPIGSSLLASFMQLKLVLLSGPAHEISRQDLDHLQGLLDEFRDISLQLYPDVPLLAMQTSSASDAEVEAATQNMQAAILRLGQWLEQNHENYGFVQMHQLMAGLRATVDQGASSQMFDNIDKILEVAPNVKRLLVAGDQNQIGGREWKKVFLTVARGLGVWLKFHYGFTQGFDRAMIRRSVPSILMDLSLVFEDAVRSRPNSQIPQSEWQDLLEKLSSVGWLPEGVTSDGLMQVWDWLLRRPLGDGQPQGGFGEMQVQHLSGMAHRWLALMDAASGDRSRIDPSELQKYLAVRDASAPLAWDDSGRLLFADPAQAWNPSSETRFIWPYVLVDWIKEAYVGTQPQALSEEQITSIVQEVLPLVQNLGFLTGTQASIGVRLLREADLFTSASDGDGKLSVAEATRYLASVMSALQASQVWLDQAQNLCSDLRVDCVRNIGLDGRSQALSSMPYLKTFFHGDTARFTTYMKQAEEIALGAQVKGSYSTGDLMQVWMLFQYVETFMGNFDANHSQTIELPEAMQSYQVFGPTLKKLLEPVGLPDNEVLAFFTFLMKYGDTPFDPDLFGGQVLFNHWKWHQNDWAFQADRTTLMQILKQLASS